MIHTLILTLFFSLSVFAETPTKKIHGLVIDAESSLQDSENETTELEGHVQIIYKNQHLIADRAVINYRAKSVDAVGNVTITNENTTIGGQRVLLDLDTNTGIIYNGYVQSGSVLFEGETLYKIGDNEFIADQAKYTTCSNCPEAWSFTGTRIRAELGGYAYIKNSLLRFGGFPVFWFPYLIVPLKSDRQSGLLTPDFERSTAGGFTVAESYFWAINRSQDTTWTLKNYELRGLKGLLNYRYMLTEKSQGELDTAWLQDKVFPTTDRYKKFSPVLESKSYIDRWFLKYDHYYDLSDGYTHRVQLNNAADLQYPKDFPLETHNNGDAAMENRISISRTSGNFFWSADASYFINLLQSNPLGDNKDAVHRLPEIQVAQGLTNVGKSDFLYNWNLDYTNFARGNFAFDSLNQGYSLLNQRYLLAHNSSGANSVCDTASWDQNPFCYEFHNATFDSSKDLIRTGQRLDGQASIQYPLKAGKIDIVPRLSYRETEYTFSVGSYLTTVRRYARADISARTIYSKVMNIDNSQDRIKHEFQPEITATSIPWIYQPNHPFFGNNAQSSPFSAQDNISDSDLNSPYGLQFDYNDRTYDRKIVNLALINKLIRKVWNNGNPTYKQFLTWKMAQSYDFYQADGNAPNQPWSDVSSDLSLSLDRFSIYQRINYYPYQTVTNSSSRVRFTSEIGDFLQLGYDLSYNITPGQKVDANTRTEQYSVTARKSLSLIDFLGKIIFDINQPATKLSNINSYGFGAQMRLPGECWYITILQYRPTGGDENFKFAFDFSFDGVKKPGFSESLLDTFSF